MRFLFSTLSMLALVACLNQGAGSTPPPAPIDAGVAGLNGDFAFPVVTAQETHLTDFLGLPVGYGFALYSTTFSCTAALDGGSPLGPYLEVLGLVGCYSGCGPPLPGDYAIATPGTEDQLVASLALAQLVDGGASSPIGATSGTITFSYTAPDQLVGTFDVELPDAATGASSELQGSFDVPFCQ